MLVRSRWLDIGHSFLRFYRPRWIRAEVNKNANRARLIYSYLDWTSVVNKGFIVWPIKRMFSCGTNKGILGGQNGPILQHFFCFAGQFIDWVLLKCLHNGDLSSKAKATTLDNVQFFLSDLWKTKMIMIFDPYGALVINRSNRILFVFHLYYYSRHKLKLLLNDLCLARFVKLTFWFKTLFIFFCM